MPYVLVHQATADYTQWRKVFDAAAPMRAEAGCTDALVLQEQADPHKLVILFEFEDLDRAQQYIENPQLKQAWQRAAVEGDSEIHLLTQPGDA